MVEAMTQTRPLNIGTARLLAIDSAVARLADQMTLAENKMDAMRNQLRDVRKRNADFMPRVEIFAILQSQGRARNPSRSDSRADMEAEAEGAARKVTALENRLEQLEVKVENNKAHQLQPHQLNVAITESETVMALDHRLQALACMVEGMGTELEQVKSEQEEVRSEAMSKESSAVLDPNSLDTASMEKLSASIVESLDMGEVAKAVFSTLRPQLKTMIDEAVQTKIKEPVERLDTSLTRVQARMAAMEEQLELVNTEHRTLANRQTEVEAHCTVIENSVSLVANQLLSLTEANQQRMETTETELQELHVHYEKVVDQFDTTTQRVDQLQGSLTLQFQEVFRRLNEAPTAGGTTDDGPGSGRKGSTHGDGSRASSAARSASRPGSGGAEPSGFAGMAAPTSAATEELTSRVTQLVEDTEKRDIDLKTLLKRAATMFEQMRSDVDVAVLNAQMEKESLVTEVKRYRELYNTMVAEYRELTERVAVDIQAIEAMQHSVAPASSASRSSAGSRVSSRTSSRAGLPGSRAGSRRSTLIGRTSRNQSTAGSPDNSKLQRSRADSTSERESRDASVNKQGATPSTGQLSGQDSGGGGGSGETPASHRPATVSGQSRRSDSGALRPHSASATSHRRTSNSMEAESSSSSSATGTDDDGDSRAQPSLNNGKPQTEGEDTQSMQGSLGGGGAAAADAGVVDEVARLRREVDTLKKIVMASGAIESLSTGVDEFGDELHREDGQHKDNTARNQGIPVDARDRVLVARPRELHVDGSVDGHVSQSSAAPGIQLQYAETGVLPGLGSVEGPDMASDGPRRASLNEYLRDSKLKPAGAGNQGRQDQTSPSSRNANDNNHTAGQRAAVHAASPVSSSTSENVDVKIEDDNDDYRIADSEVTEVVIPATLRSRTAELQSPDPGAGFGVDVAEENRPPKERHDREAVRMLLASLGQNRDGGDAGQRVHTAKQHQHQHQHQQKEQHLHAGQAVTLSHTTSLAPQKPSQRKPAGKSEPKRAGRQQLTPQEQQQQQHRTYFQQKHPHQQLRRPPPKVQQLEQTQRVIQARQAVQEREKQQQEALAAAEAQKEQHTRSARATAPPSKEELEQREVQVEVLEHALDAALLAGHGVVDFLVER